MHTTNFVMKYVAWDTYELCSHGFVWFSLLVLLHEGLLDMFLPFATGHVNVLQNEKAVVRHWGYSLRLQNDQC